MKERQIDSKTLGNIFGPEIHHDNFPGTPGYRFNPDIGDYESIEDTLGNQTEKSELIQTKILHKAA